MITIADIQRKQLRDFYLVLDAVCRERKYLAWTEAPPFRDVKAFVLNSMAKGNPQVVALDNGKVVGWCDITPQSRRTTKHCGSLGMGLVRDYRNKGIGTQLIYAALQRAKAHGLYRVELEVFEENVTAIHLYKKVGFKEEGRKPCAVRIGDNYVNAIIMGLLLKDYSGIKES
jgi:RimJ/RimL family protein N-acetyltransferase